MNSYRKLFDNFLVFTLGNMGSKIISFLLVPLYTHYLTQSEYGTADIVLITTSLLMPIVSAAMYEAILRFTIDKEVSNSRVLTNALIISGIGYVLLLLFYPILNNIDGIKDNIYFFYIILLLQMINKLFAQYARGIGEVKKFAINGMLISFLTGILNISFLVIFELGLKGYFWSYVFSYALSTLYLILSIKPFHNIRFSSSDKNARKNLLAYSMPLIPNTIMWWLINGSSRYFINWFIGIEANGVFAVSSRIPALINLVSTVFTQAWQMSVFEEIDKKNKTEFFSHIFDMYSSILFLTVSGVIVILKPLFSVVFSDSFFRAWEPAPFLLIGTVFAAFSSFFESIYTGSRQTSGVFKTSFYGGILSIVLNLFLVPSLGITGAGISSLMCFVLMFFLRYFDTKKILSFTIKWKKFFLTSLLILGQSIVLYLNANIYIEMFSSFLIFVLVLFFNRNIFKIIPFFWNTYSK